MSEEAFDTSEQLDDVFRSDYHWLTQKLRYRLDCGDNAEDVASETFTQLAALPYLKEIREPRAMLMTIATRVVYEGRRRRDRERAHLLELTNHMSDQESSPERIQLLRSELEAIDTSLQVLSEKARQAFYHSQLDGLTYAEIGLRLGVSASMVRQYIAKALQQCRQAIGSEEK